jgi:hypothetical protein
MHVNYIQQRLDLILSCFRLYPVFNMEFIHELIGFDPSTARSRRPAASPQEREDSGPAKMDADTESAIRAAPAAGGKGLRKIATERPKTNPTSIRLTLIPAQLARLDAFIAGQGERLSRAEAVRRLLDQALPEIGSAKPISAAAEAARASKPRQATPSAPAKKARPRRP